MCRVRPLHSLMPGEHRHPQGKRFDERLRAGSGRRIIVSSLVVEFVCFVTKLFLPPRHKGSHGLTVISEKLAVREN